MAEAKYKEWKEKESKDVMEKVRQQHHFESTWRTGQDVIKHFIYPSVHKKLQCLSPRRPFQPSLKFIFFLT